MSKSLLRAMGGKERIDEPEISVIALEAIVAVNDDPEHQHRVKVVIPSIDENLICDKWVKCLGVFAGPPGYGSFHLPEIGSEVVLFGRLAQKHNLYYASVFNESFIVPADFRTPAVRGFRTDGDYKAIAELDYQLRAGRLNVEVDASVQLIAPGGVFINGRRF